MREISDRRVLAEVQSEVTAPGGQHEGSVNGRCPDDLTADQAFDVAGHGVAVVAGLADGRVRLGAQHHRIRPINARPPQVPQRLGDRRGIVAHIGREGHGRVGRLVPDADDARCRVPLEDGPVLGEGDLPRGVLHGLPVGVLGAPLDVVDRATVHRKRHPQLDERPDLPLTGQHPVLRRLDVGYVAGAHAGQHLTGGAMHIHHPPPGQVALDGAHRLLFDLRPGGARNGGKLAVEVIHAE